jgi:hypothetical protein
MNPHLSLKGRAKVQVLQEGRVVRRTKFQRNLLLDQGLDNLATEYICDLFKVAVKGTGLEPTKEDAHADNDYSWTSGTSIVTKNSPVLNDRVFTISDVGRLIRFEGGEEALITGYNSATSVDVDRIAASTLTNKSVSIYRVNQVGLGSEEGRTATYSTDTSENGTTTASAVRTFQRTFVFDQEASDEEVVAGTYSRSGSAVTRDSGTRDFTPSDVGKIIRFDTDGVEATITVFTDATHVTVDTTGALAAQPVRLYGFKDYTEIGFSHSEDVDNNLNIRILLDSPVRAYGPTGLNPAQQLKVTYELQLAVSPASVQPSPSTYSTFPITDTLNVMSSNKQGQHAIENFLTSEVDDDGETIIANALLDPCVAGECGLSLDSTALSAFGGTARESGARSKAFIPGTYDPGDFSLDYTVDFTISEVISSSWRSFMLYHPDSGLPAYTWLFRNVQRKDGNHSLTLTLTKTWGRDLS